MSLNNLTFDKESKIFRSGQWDISQEDAQSLLGGWVYLHSAKAELSEFGGLILGFKPVIDERLAHAERIVLTIQKRLEGTGQRWRGKGHVMAHSGGIIEGCLLHEKLLNSRNLLVPRDARR